MTLTNSLRKTLVQSSRICWATRDCVYSKCSLIISSSSPMSSGDSTRSSCDRGQIAAVAEFAVPVPHVGDAAGHAGGEVAAGGAQNHGAAAGHVLAAMIPHAFDDGPGAAVADAEPFGGATAEERLAAGGAVQAHVANQDVPFGRKSAGLGRIDDQPAAGESLAHVVVRVPFQFQRDAAGQKRPEALSGRTVKLEVNRVVRQTLARRTCGPRDG